jgi:hypothetical protein
MLFCRKNFTAKRSVDISPGPIKPVVHQRTVGHLFAEGSSSKLLYVCEGSQGAGDFFFLLRITTLEALQDDRVLSVSGLAGEPIKYLNTAVRGIGSLPRIVPILLLVITEDR